MTDTKLVQADDFFPSPAADGHQWDAFSSWNDTFERLVQPPADAGFAYVWLNASSFPTTSMTVFTINGFTPCCIPVGTNRVSRPARLTSPCATSTYTCHAVDLSIPSYY